MKQRERERQREKKERKRDREREWSLIAVCYVCVGECRWTSFEPACWARPADVPEQTTDDEPDSPGSSIWLLVAAGFGGALIPVALGKIKSREGKRLIEQELGDGSRFDAWLFQRALAFYDAV